MKNRSIVYIACAAILASIVLTWVMRPQADSARSPGVESEPGVNPGTSDQLRSGSAAYLLDAPPSVKVTPPAQSPAERFRLHGVIAGSELRSAKTSALISVDGKSVALYRLGDALTDVLSVLSVDRDGVEIGPPGGPPLFKLQSEVRAATAQQLLAPKSEPATSPDIPKVTPPISTVVPPGMVLQGSGLLPPGMVIEPTDKVPSGMVIKPSTSIPPGMPGGK